MTNPYKMFQINKELEREGVWIWYGSKETGFAFKIARSGSRNTEYTMMMAEEVKPYLDLNDLNFVGDPVSAIMGLSESMPPDVMDEITRKVYAHTIILDWDGNITDQDGNSLVVDENGERIPYSPEACMVLLKDLPELFDDIIQKSGRRGTFQGKKQEEKVKN